jgi:type IV pilus assembly protein PilC
MSSFVYEAFDQAGRRRSGRVEATSREVADRTLRDQGLRPVEVVQARAARKALQISLGRARPAPEVLVATCRQLATMVGAGVALSGALQVLEQQSEPGLLKAALADMNAQIREGRPLAKALAMHPKVFPPIVANLVRAGEVTGNLDTALDQAATLLEKQWMTAGKFKSALTYPAVVLAMTLVVATFMIVKVIPSVVETFVQMDLVLPAPTRAVLAVSRFLQSWGLLLVGAAAIASFLAVRYVRTPGGRLLLDRLVLKLPVFGRLAQLTAMARMARTLGGMVGSAVPILEALDVTAATLGNSAVARALLEGAESLRAGGSLSAPLRENPLFPPLVVQMVAIGEESGALEVMLLKIAEFYEADAERMVERLQPLLEPFLMAFMGVIVGGLVLAAVLPSLSLASQVGG